MNPVVHLHYTSWESWSSFVGPKKVREDQLDHHYVLETGPLSGTTKLALFTKCGRLDVAFVQRYNFWPLVVILLCEWNCTPIGLSVFSDKRGNQRTALYLVSDRSFRHRLSSLN